jgi:hypothetical protein
MFVKTLVTSSQSNGMGQNLAKSLKREYAKFVNMTDFKTLMAYPKDRFDDYRSYHSRSLLDYMPPKLFGEKRAVI